MKMLFLVLLALLLERTHEKDHHNPRNGTILQKDFTRLPGRENDFFGFNITITENGRLLVSSNLDDWTTDNTKIANWGLVYLWQENTDAIARLVDVNATLQESVLAYLDPDWLFKPSDVSRAEMDRKKCNMQPNLAVNHTIKTLERPTGNETKNRVHVVTSMSECCMYCTQSGSNRWQCKWWSFAWLVGGFSTPDGESADGAEPVCKFYGPEARISANSYEDHTVPSAGSFIGTGPQWYGPTCVEDAGTITTAELNIDLGTGPECKPGECAVQYVQQATSEEDCCAACQNNERKCYAYQWRRGENAKCHLAFRPVTSCTKTEADSGDVCLRSPSGGYIVVPRPTTTKRLCPHAAGFRYYEGPPIGHQDYHINMVNKTVADVSTVLTNVTDHQVLAEHVDVDDCCELCLVTANCTRWSWDRKHKMCLLFKRDPIGSIQVNMTNVTFDNLVSTVQEDLDMIYFTVSDDDFQSGPKVEDYVFKMEDTQLFGYSISAFGRFVVVSTRPDNPSVNYPMVIVFKEVPMGDRTNYNTNTWTVIQKITEHRNEMEVRYNGTDRCPDYDAGCNAIIVTARREHYGKRVLIQDGWLFVTSPKGNGSDFEGEVFVYGLLPGGPNGAYFDRVQVLIGQPNTIPENDLFGRHIAASTRLLAVTAPLYRQPYQSVVTFGRVYLFFSQTAYADLDYEVVLPNGKQAQGQGNIQWNSIVINPPEKAGIGFFGTSVAVNADMKVLLIGTNRGVYLIHFRWITVGYLYEPQLDPADRWVELNWDEAAADEDAAHGLYSWPLLAALHNRVGVSTGLKAHFYVFDKAEQLWREQLNNYIDLNVDKKKDAEKAKLVAADMALSKEMVYFAQPKFADTAANKGRIQAFYLGTFSNTPGGKSGKSGVPLGTVFLVGVLCLAVGGLIAVIGYRKLKLDPLNQPGYFDEDSSGSRRRSKKGRGWLSRAAQEIEMQLPTPRDSFLGDVGGPEPTPRGDELCAPPAKPMSGQMFTVSGGEYSRHTSNGNRMRAGSDPYEPGLYAPQQRQPSSHRDIDRHHDPWDDRHRNKAPRYIPHNVTQGVTLDEEDDFM